MGGTWPGPMQCFPRAADTPIRTDAAGRYCLNDLHRASGGAGHHQPGKFFANKGTQELVAELRSQSPNSESEPVRAIVGGAAPATYVAKELVYAYAMWISPAFHLKVIRAYDAMVAQPAAPAVPQTLPEALRLAVWRTSALPRPLPCARARVVPPVVPAPSAG